MVENDEAVHLKPFLGLKAGKYLAILYASVIAVILFLTLVVPSLVHPGSIMQFTSVPEGAAVRVDDVYFGTSPCKFFVAQGKHTFTYVLPGFVNYQRN